MDSHQPGAPHLSAPDMRPAKPAPSRRRRVFWFLVVLVICGGMLGGFAYIEYVKKPEMIAEAFSHMPPPTPVEVYKAATQAMPRRLNSIGTLTAVHQVTVSPEVAGRIIAVKFESGTAVKDGDVLVQLDDATERADLATYQAQARLATLNLGRAKELAAKQFSSKQSVDALKSELDQANAGIMKSQATIQYKVIKAPFDGVLGIRQINLGEYLGAGTAIVTLTDLDNLYIDFSLPEQDLAHLSIGQDVEIRVDAFPTRVFLAKLETIDPQVDPTMRAAKLRAALANPDHLLQPGMYGKVAVVLPSESNVVTIPETAIDYSVYGASVFVVREGKDKDKDGKPQYTVEQVFVTAGAQNEGKVGVIKGVAPGDVVVVGGQTKLYTGAAVTISKDRSLENPAEMPVE